MTEWNPSSLNALTNRIGTTRNANVRLAFEPFGKRKVGVTDPDHPNYQLVDAEAYAYFGRIDYTIFLEDEKERRFVLCPGSKFKDEKWELKNEFPEQATLSDLGYVLGIEVEKDSGFVPVGVNVVVLTN